MGIIFGLLSLVVAFIGFFVATLPLGLLSIVLGIVGLITNKEGDTAGYILSIVGRVISLILIVVKLISLC